MNVSRIIVAMAVCVLSSQPSWGQEASPASSRGVLGYWDTATGAFRPVTQTEDFDSESLAATTPQTGTITVNFTVTIRSAIPANTPIQCGVSASVTEIAGLGVSITSESATMVATRTGNSARCTVTIPYSWLLLNPASAKLSLLYTVSAGRATAAAGLVARSSSGTIASIPVPATGSTTTQSVNAVL